jgi:hypothetical protein
MPATAPSPIASYQLNGRELDWHPFGKFTGFVYTILDVNVGKRTIDMMFKFEPNRNCFYHRHVAPATSLVLEGEHHIYERGGDGETVHTIRTAGTFAISGGGDVHIEGGGEQGCTVLFSMRGDSDHIYDILDDDLNIVREISIHDFAETFEKIRAAA